MHAQVEANALAAEAGTRVAPAQGARGRARWKRIKLVDATVPAEVYGYYMWTWKLFYASYACLPFLR